jgi:hypothetical protein
MPLRHTRGTLARLLQCSERGSISEKRMKMLTLAVILSGAVMSSACAPLVAGGVGAAVGAAAERDRQQDEREERERRD